VKDWSATAEVPGGDPARASVHVVLFAASLHDEEEGLSDGDRRKVDERAAGPDTLDAARHPRIELRSERIDLARGAADAPKLRGTLHGTLTVRGRSVPISLPFELARAGPGWTVKGTTRVEQSKLGITPFSGFGGTVKVKDELEVELSVRLVPASG
jgi:polyisoprenoid-binding protein YceI